MKRITFFAIFVMAFFLALSTPPTTNAPEEEAKVVPKELVYIPTPQQPVADRLVVRKEVRFYSPETTEEEPLMAEEDIELIALLTMAEAEGECEEGQRLVIDTVLNRMDNPHFPDSVWYVVYQPNQYAGMESPRIDKCYVKEELTDLVKAELNNRSNNEVIFFRTEHYSKYGTPLFQVGSHYFSSY